MPYRNLDEFLTRLEHQGDVQHIAFTNESADEVRRTGGGGRVSVFEDAERGIRLVHDLFATEQRVAEALRVASFDLIAARVEALLELGKPGTLGTMISGAMTMFSAIRTTTNRRASQQYRRVPYEAWRDGLPSFLKVEWPTAISATLLTGAPSSRMQHVGVGFDGRQLFVERDLSLGERITLVVGGDPGYLLAARMPLPPFIHPSFLASWLREKPLDLMRLPDLDVDVPSNAEVVITGTVSALPFKGGWVERSIIDVTDVWTVERPIFPNLYGRAAFAVTNAWLAIFRPILQRMLPGLRTARVHGEFGILTVDTAMVDRDAVARAFWGVPAIRWTSLWLMFPQTAEADIDAAISAVRPEDVGGIIRLEREPHNMGLLFDMTVPPYERRSEADAVLISNMFKAYIKPKTDDTNA